MLPKRSTRRRFTSSDGHHYGSVGSWTGRVRTHLEEEIGVPPAGVQRASRASRGCEQRAHLPDAGLPSLGSHANSPIRAFISVFTRKPVAVDIAASLETESSHIGCGIAASPCSISAAGGGARSICRPRDPLINRRCSSLSSQS